MREGLKKGMEEGMREGLKKGIEEGIKEGKEEGKKEEKKAIAANLKKMGMDISLITNITGLSEEEVGNL